jgi:hypothetical protein
MVAMERSVDFYASQRIVNEILRVRPRLLDDLLYQCLVSHGDDGCGGGGDEVEEEDDDDGTSIDVRVPVDE